MELIEPYASRPIRSLGQWVAAGLRLKVHDIGYQFAQPCAEVIEAACDLVERELPQLIAGRNHYGAGVVGAHDGRGSIFVFIDFWADENELRHHACVAPKDQPARLEYVTPSGWGYMWTGDNSRGVCWQIGRWNDQPSCPPRRA